MNLIINNHTEIGSKEIESLFLILNEKYRLKVTNVDYIHICEDKDFINCIYEINENIYVTDLSGCEVKGKTIYSDQKVNIVIKSSIISDILSNLVIDKNIFEMKIDALTAVKTIYHEFGHAEYDRNKANSNFVIGSDYSKNIKNLWGLLLDESKAEFNIAELSKAVNNVYWYGSPDSMTEEKNLVYYLQFHYNKEKKLHFNQCLYYLHIYYLIPLFQKYAYFFGIEKLMKQAISFNSEILDKIKDLNIFETKDAPKEYNDIILQLWEDFEILKYLNGEF